MLSARRWRIHPPGGIACRDRRWMESQVLMNTAMNSRMLMCHMPGGRGLYRGGSVVRTGQPREAKVDEDRRHLKGGERHQPPRPS